MVDYKKRELNKLCKAYNEIHDVVNGYYLNQINGADSKHLRTTLDGLEYLFTLNGYELKVSNSDKFVLVRAK